MLEYAGSQRAGRREREALHLLAVVRSFDWILVAGLAALVVVGLWGIGGVTSHDVAGNPNYYLNKQILYAAAGGLVLVAAALVDPDLYRRYWRLIYAGTVGSDRGRLSRRQGRRRRYALDRRRLLPVPAVGVREAPRRPRARRAARRAPGRDRRVVDDAEGPAVRRSADLARLRPAGSRHRARLHGRARGDALRRRHAVVAPLDARR